MKRLMVCVVSGLVGAAFGTEWPDSGEVTIPAGETWVATEADMPKVNNLTSITIEGGTNDTPAGVLEFKGCSAPPKADLLRGAGTVQKTGPQEWTMKVAQPNFKGDFILAGGVVTDTIEKSFGDTAKGVGKLCIRDGATLYIDSTAPRFCYREVRIAGAGSMPYPAAIYIRRARSGVFAFLSLDADATVYVASGENYYWVGNQGDPRGDRSGDSVIDLQGFTFTRSGPMAFYTLGLTFKGTGRIVTPDLGSVVFRESSKLSDGIFELGSGDVSVALYNRINPIERPLLVKGTAAFYSDANSTSVYIPDTNGNCYAGPVTLDGANTALRFIRHKYSDNQLMISGTVGGEGRVVQNADVQGRNILAGHNTYTGGTTVNGLGYGRIAAFWHDSIPDYANTTVADCGTLVAMPGLTDGTERWPKAKIFEALNTMDFAPRGHFAIDADYCTNSTYELSLGELNAGVTRPQLNLSADGGTFRITSEEGETARIAPSAMRGTLELSGPGTYTLAGTNEVYGYKAGIEGAGTVKVCDGATVLQGPGVQMLLGFRDSSSIFNTAGLAPIGRLVISNATWLSTVSEKVTGETIDDIRSGSIYVGSRYGGVLEVEAGGVVSNAIFVGGGETFSGGSGAGAIYVKKGGEIYVKTLATKSHISSRIGQAGFAYVEVNGGTFGADTLRLGGYGGSGTMLSVYGGGRVVADRHLDIAGCNNDGNVAVLNVFDGSVTMENGDFTLCAGGSGTRSAVNVCGSNAVMTVKGSKRAYVQSNVNAKWTLFTLADGGLMNMHSYYKYKDTSAYTQNYPYPLVVNFNGGIASVYDQDNCRLFDTSPSNRTDVVAVYGKGMTIDVTKRTVTQSTYMPFEGKREGGIRAIAFGEPVTGLFAPPAVMVSGGGYAASVVPDWDPETRVLKGLRILAPGWGYTQGDVTITLKNGQWTRTISGADVTVGTNEIGGFTCRGYGAGTMVLNSTANSWEKWTRVEGIKLKVGAAGVVPADTELQLYGGTLDVNHTDTNEVGAVTFGGFAGTGGTAINGAVRIVGEWRISAKKFIDRETTALAGTLDLSEVTGITLTDTGLLDDEEVRKLKRMNLFSATEVVWPETLEITGVPEGWKVIRRPNGLSFGVERGLMLILR